MQPTLILQNDYGHFIAQPANVYYSTYDFTIIGLPTINELEIFLCDVVPQIRIVNLKLDYYTEETPIWVPKFIKIITDLALKYRPWQFQWLSQESGSITIEWVEVKEWHYKYTNKAGYYS